MQPVDTEFGRKTRIDQILLQHRLLMFGWWTARHLSPSKLTRAIYRPGVASAPPTVPEPRLPTVDSSTGASYLAGIGGTGIVTVNQVLATAALQQGLQSPVSIKRGYHKRPGR